MSDETPPGRPDEAPEFRSKALSLRRDARAHVARLRAERAQRRRLEKEVTETSAGRERAPDSTSGHDTVGVLCSVNTTEPLPLSHGTRKKAPATSVKPLDPRTLSSKKAERQLPTPDPRRTEADPFETAALAEIDEMDETTCSMHSNSMVEDNARVLRQDDQPSITPAEPSSPKDVAPRKTSRSTPPPSDFCATCDPALDVIDKLQSECTFATGTEESVEIKHPLAEVFPEATDTVRALSLNDLPGAGPGLVWMLNECGISDLRALSLVDPSQLSADLGLVGQILDVDIWVQFAKDQVGAQVP